MEKENRNYSRIESIVKQHKKFPGLESILDDIIDDVYSHSEVILNTVTNECVVNAYLEKVVSTSIITVPKRLGIRNNLSSQQSVSEIDIKPKSQEYHAHDIPKVDKILVDKMINTAEPDTVTSFNNQNIVDVDDGIRVGSVNQEENNLEPADIMVEPAEVLTEEIEQDFINTDSDINEELAEPEVNSDLFDDVSPYTEETTGAGNNLSEGEENDVVNATDISETEESLINEQPPSEPIQNEIESIQDDNIIDLSTVDVKSENTDTLNLEFTADTTTEPVVMSKSIEEESALPANTIDLDSFIVDDTDTELNSLEVEDIIKNENDVSEYSVPEADETDVIEQNDTTDDNTIDLGEFISDTPVKELELVNNIESQQDNEENYIAETADSSLNLQETESKDAIEEVTEEGILTLSEEDTVNDGSVDLVNSTENNTVLEEDNTDSLLEDENIIETLTGSESVIEDDNKEEAIEEDDEILEAEEQIAEIEESIEDEDSLLIGDSSSENISLDLEEDTSLEDTGNDDDLVFLQDENNAESLALDDDIAEESLEIEEDSDIDEISHHDTDSTEQQVLTDYSVFGFEPEPDESICDNIDADMIANDLQELATKTPDVDIIKIYNLKYKENQTIPKIASDLQISEEQVIDALNEIIAVI